MAGQISSRARNREALNREIDLLSAQVDRRPTQVVEIQEGEHTEREDAGQLVAGVHGSRDDSKRREPTSLRNSFPTAPPATVGFVARRSARTTTTELLDGLGGLAQKGGSTSESTSLTGTAFSYQTVFRGKWLDDRYAA